MVAHAYNPSTRTREEDWKATLGYIGSSRLALATQLETVSKRQRKEEGENSSSTTDTSSRVLYTRGKYCNQEEIQEKYK